MSLYSRSFPLVLFLPFLILPGNPARANDDPTECKACSANATSLQAVKDVLGAGDENDPSKLSKEELKEIEKSRKELVENKLVSRQKYTYNEQAYEFKRYAFAYRRVFGSDEKDPEKLFKIIASSDSVDQAVKNAKLKAKKLDDPKVQEAIALLKDSHNRIWYRDPELKSLTSRLFVDPDKQEKLVANLVKAHFKDEKRIAEMDRLLTSQYIEAKQQYLAKKKKKSFSKEDLKNLDITFNLEPPVAGAPSDDYKTLNLSELQDLAVQKSAGTDHASIFCQPLPNNPKYLNEDDPVLAGKSGVDPEFSTSPPQTEYQDILHQDTCDLKQTFPPDSAEVTADSRKVLQDCLARAKSNPDCAGG
ncbi:MAG: hypothetical protein EBX52_07315, partial [Proteobacteria bacterium]|nr:hypothetical protein [Pseudomonadota bacterium]